MAKNGTRRIGIDISDSGYQKLRDAKKRWKINFGAIIDILLHHCDISEFEEHAARVRRGQPINDEEKHE